MRRILYGRWYDYALLAVFGASPLASAWVAGVAWSTTVSTGAETVDFKGYWQSQWAAWPILLPLSLLLFRSVVWCIAPARGARAGAGGIHPDPDPPTAHLFPRAGRQVARRRLNAALASRANLLAALGVAAAITVLDVREVLSDYATVWWGGRCVCREADWSVMFAAGHGVNLWVNLLHVALAFAVQGVGVAIGVLLIVVCARHNWFFVSSIYQRRHAGHLNEQIAVDLDDQQSRFGFSAAKWAFHVQAFVLVIGALVLILGTRLPNTRPEQQLLLERVPPALSQVTAGEIEPAVKAIENLVLFHDIGQWLTLGGWLAMLAVVALPLTVKFLPIPCWKRATDVCLFLQEYVPPHAWTWQDVTNARDRFRQNPYWPSGDAVARVMLWVAIFCLLWLVFPVQAARTWRFAGFLFALAVASTAFEEGLRKVLGYVLPLINDAYGS